MVSNSDVLTSISPKLKAETEWILEKIKLKQIAFNRLTFSGYKKALSDGFLHWPSRKKYMLEELTTIGFKSLKLDDYWLLLETSAFKLLKNEIAVAFTRSLFYFYKISTDQPDAERIGTIHFGKKGISLIDIYRHSMSLGESLRDALEKMRDDPTLKDGTKCNVANNVIWTIKNIIIERKPCHTLDSAYQALISEIKKHNLTKSKILAIKTNFRALMRLYNPSTYGGDTISIGKHMVDITTVSKLSAVFKVQLEKISETDHMKGTHGHKIQANVTRLHAVLRTVIKLCGADDVFSRAFNKKGLDCLATNDFLFLKSVFSKVSQNEANELKRLYEIYTGEKIPKPELNEYLLSFFNKASGQTKTIDISKLLQFGQKFISDIVDLHESETDLNDQKNYGMETLHTRFSILMKATKYINREAANKHGLHFLSERAGKYQIELLSSVQAACLNKTISRRTAEGIFSSVRWICQITNQPFIDAYRITSNRHVLHAARLCNKDTYTLEEVRELAFYIEKSIANDAISPKSLLALHFAKIQIKTCLNTASLITVECSDIQQVDVPTKDKPITVLIQKPRKGYKTDYFNFDPKFPNSAIHDLLYVRDHLTSELRKKFSNNALSKSLFVYEEAGHLKNLTNTNTVAHIAQLLVNAGCSVKYNSAKLRKTGANEVYRQLTKDVSRYKDALKHTYATFLKHYQRINEAKQKLNLQDATETMDKYFTGREISSEIKIVTEYSKSTQLTPLGGCTSNLGSKEAIAYNKSHASLDSSTLLRCGDFLACVWCKYYRVVADANHIWQLLSFKNFVLSSMESSVAHFSNASIQKQAIDAIKYRVDSIIRTIKSLDSSAAHEGEMLMRTKGMHPDWEFALPTLRLTS